MEKICLLSSKARISINSSEMRRLAALWALAASYGCCAAARSEIGAYVSPVTHPPCGGRSAGGVMRLSGRPSSPAAPQPPPLSAVSALPAAAASPVAATGASVTVKGESRLSQPHQSMHQPGREGTTGQGRRAVSESDVDALHARLRMNGTNRRLCFIVGVRPLCPTAGEVRVGVPPECVRTTNALKGSSVIRVSVCVGRSSQGAPWLRWPTQAACSRRTTPSILCP